MPFVSKMTKTKEVTLRINQSDTSGEDIPKLISHKEVRVASSI